MKQTAVEWLEYQLSEGTMPIKEAFKQAKEMEKEQIIDAFDCGIYDGGENVSHYNMNAEQYYNETFKSE